MWWIIYRSYLLDNKKKATVNPVNKIGNKCFQYAVIVALNCEKIKGHPERTTKIKLSINKYKWKWKGFNAF